VAGFQTFGRGRIWAFANRGRELFARLSIDPYQSLSTDELAFLGVNIRKRHVVGHNLSMVDDAYQDAATTETIGETVSLVADEVERFAALCQTVIVQVVDQCPEFLPPAQAQTGVTEA
jgi:hypothetical protein